MIMDTLQFTPKQNLMINTIFCLGDALYDIMFENLQDLNAVGITLKGSTLFRFKQMMKTQKMAESAYLNFLKDSEELKVDEFDSFSMDGEILKKFIILLVDRIVNNPKNMRKIWDYMQHLESQNILKPCKEL